MRIIVDAFGGDNAPLEVIKGAAMAVAEYGHTVVLVGREEEIRRVAADKDIPLTGMEIVDAPDVISMEDEPKSILKEHKDCSMAEGMRPLGMGTRLYLPAAPGRSSWAVPSSSSGSRECPGRRWRR